MKKKKRIKYFDIKNVNDDLIILDDDKEFVYNPKNKESHRLQMTLFNEKKKIIEKTLFGVDINPNSVNICRLRLWIELLKSSYIKNINSTSPQFETLPNIDINIKQGDSLLSLYNVDSNLSLITKDSKYKVEDYRDAITRYVSTNDKNEKKNLVVLIEDIKKSFKNKIKTEQKKLKKKRQLTTELFELDNQLQLFETSSSKEVKEKRKTLIKKINEVNLELEKIEERKHIDNIFEWRFEFPEILNENADFIGFDIIVGNPPYFNLSPSQKQLYEFGDVYKHVNNKITNITSLFIYLSLFRLLKPNGYFSFIVPKSITFVDSWKRIRESILNKTTLLETYDVGKAFEGVGLEQVILICKNTSDQSNITKTFQDFKNTNNISQSYFTKYNIILNSITPKVLNIITSLQKNTNKLCEIAEFPRGTNISGKDRTSIKSENCVLYLGGNNISQFRIKDGGLRKPNQFVDKNLIKEKQKSKLSSVNKKIIYQNIMSSKARIVAALDSQNYYTGDTVNNLILNTNEYSYEYILAYLNSPLATFYLKYFIINNGTLTVHLDKPYIGSLPIKKINESKNLKIKKLVDSLNKSYDYKIHKELNSIIYDIYNLDSVDANYIETDLGIGY